MTLTDLLDVTCCSVVVRTFEPHRFIQPINSTYMQCPISEIYERYPFVYSHRHYEVLSLNAFYNGVETILTVII